MPHEKEQVSIRDYYNRRFIAGHLKRFIHKYNHLGDINPNSTPIRSSQANLLQKMHLNSPLRQTLREGSGSASLKPVSKDFSPMRDGFVPQLKSPMMMTPISKQLFATESPFPVPSDQMLKK